MLEPLPVERIHPQTARLLLRDFPSVTIGNQVWMTKNWDYKTPKSWYFDNDSINNLKYGRLYYFSNALAAAPPGWHLPTLDDWQELNNYFGGDEKALPALLEGDHPD